jgi:DNA polymerase-1
LILKLGLDALHAELVGISFSYEKERILRTLSENQVEAKALAEKFMPFSKTKNRENGQNLKYDLKILSITA